MSSLDKHSFKKGQSTPPDSSPSLRDLANEMIGMMDKADQHYQRRTKSFDHTQQEQLPLRGKHGDLHSSSMSSSLSHNDSFRLASDSASTVSSHSYSSAPATRAPLDHDSLLRDFALKIKSKMVLRG
jgi:hypothetical protein